jgi:NAD(P)-dependent dehydrogenase (short-subunit alcohol dehydrogenase family)
MEVVMRRIAVVTGGARGIGRAIAEALSAAGWHVVILDQDLAPAWPGDQHRLDVSDADAVAGVFRQIIATHGGVDCLVNNAGTCLMNDLLAITPDELRRQMAVNFDSAFYACQAAIPSMLQRPGIKKIINISSNGAYNFDVFDPAHYRASKAALDTLTKHLARRYARDGIAVNSIAPAMTRTDLFDVVPADVLERALAAMPRGAPLDPAEVAAWVAFLASPAGDCSSGNVIILNQGRDVR